MDTNSESLDRGAVALTDADLDGVCGGGRISWFLLGLEAAYEVGSAIWNAAKNSKGGYPDGERTDIMGNQG